MVKTTPFDQFAPVSNERCGDDSVLHGVERAIEFARGGRLISAIKHLEANNPALMREEAKALVYSFGYGREVRWPEPERLPARCL